MRNTKMGKNVSLSPLRIACIVVGIYTLLLLVFLSRFDFNPSAAIRIGPSAHIEKYQDITPPGIVVHEKGGYDGQNYYFIALDITNPQRFDPYTYQRIGLPFLTSTLSFGNPLWIPFITQLLILVAVGVLAFVSAKCFQKRELPSWYSFIVAFSPGLFTAFTHNLLEPIALVFCVCALLLHLEKRYFFAAIFFTMGLFVKESLAVVLAPLIIWSLVTETNQGRIKLLVRYIPVGMLYLAFQLWLTTIYGQMPFFIDSGHLVFPFSGIWNSIGLLSSLYATHSMTLGVSGFHLFVLKVSQYLLVPMLLGVIYVVVKSYQRKKETGILGILAVIQSILILCIREGVWVDSLPNIARAAYLVPALFVLASPREPETKWVMAYIVFLTFVIFVGQFIVPIADPYTLTP